MIIWLNGPFGVGKTQTAFELHRRLPESFVSDPEHFGYGIHRMQPRELRGDFQDAPLWRRGVLEVLSDVDARRQQKFGSRMVATIVPMTIIRADYFDEVVGGLRDRGHDVRHFALVASTATVRRRLRGRGEGIIGHSWASRRIDEGLRSLQDPKFADHIPTDSLTIAQVAETIGRMCELVLTSDDSSPQVSWLRRRAVQLRHVRR
ncbi:AAA family ATPase [Propionibacteriaceae bacterium Y2011]